MYVIPPVPYNSRNEIWKFALWARVSFVAVPHAANLICFPILDVEGGGVTA